MADEADDNPGTANAPPTSNDEQMDELKREIAKLKEALAERAQGVYDAAAEAVRSQAVVARDNPGTIATAVVFGGIIGLLLGYALGQSEPSTRNHN